MAGLLRRVYFLFGSHVVEVIVVSFLLIEPFSSSSSSSSLFLFFFEDIGVDVDLDAHLILEELRLFLLSLLLVLEAFVAITDAALIRADFDLCFNDFEEEDDDGLVVDREYLV